VAWNRRSFADQVKAAPPIHHAEESIMYKRGALYAGTIFGLLLVTFLRAAPEPTAAKASEKLIRAKVEAARRTYEVVWANNREALVPFVEVGYRWSRRWLEAELELSDQKAVRETAYQAHRDRMQKLSRITNDRYRARANTVEEVTATDFYFAESALWLEQARSK
jgi:hypothetical protein